MKEHKEKGVKSAKYTKNHEFLKLECVWECDNRGLASKLEYKIKQLDKKQKEELIINKNLKQYFRNILDCDEYILYNFEELDEGNEYSK